MKYAIRYNSSFKYLDEIDEIIIDYHKIGNIVEFASEKIKPNQKLIINLDWYDTQIEDVIPYLNELKKIHPNFMVQIGSTAQREFIPILKDNEIDYMFLDVCTDFGSLYNAVAAGVKEVYIAEDLGFNLKEIRMIKENNNIKFRVYPDVAQTNSLFKKDMPDLTKFWIRPEDTEVYEEYIDVFEFYHDNDRLSVIYEIYKNQRWLGSIDQIIDDCNLKIDNTTIAPYFAPHRISCRRKCLVDNEYCNMCYQIISLGEKFEDAGITINRPKHKDEISEEQIENILGALMKLVEKEKEEKNDKSTSD